ncbi:hypothetical protein [Paraburkholderia youngii]|uniref:DUF2511 domain-containing protein n=1 Tax=Paraburkholderia youngii TaxID=2782701 RepID=A0ABX2NPF9_9BURK|nr:hypothetical protein [Paraburkholderia youngii]NVI06341.1 hypothetical protein [Paraburkholderia youngii]
MKKTMILISMIAAAAVASNAANSAQNWEKVASKDTGDGTATWYLDYSTITAVRLGKSAWVKQVDERESNNAVSVMKLIFQCKERQTIRLVATVTSGGESRTYDDPKVGYPQPDSPLDKVLTAVCNH